MKRRAQPPPARVSWVVRRPAYFPYLALAALSLAVYANSLGGGFITDDQFQILNNPVVTGAQGLLTAFTSGVWSFIGYHGNYYRPLQFVVYGLVYRAFGPSPFPFHLLMALLHALNTALAFWLARRLALPAAWFAAALFAVHPIHTEAVNWIAALPDVLTTTFILAGVGLFLAQGATPTMRQIAAHAALYLAALLTKETGVVLPFLYAAALVRRPSGHWPRRALWLAFAAVFAMYLALRIHALGGLAPAQQAFFQLTPIEFALSDIVLLARYLAALALPLDLNFFHVFHPTAGATPALIASVAALAVLAGLAIRYRRRSPLAVFALLWIVISIMPALNIGGVGQNVFTERYLYLPSVGFALASALILQTVRARAWGMPAAAALLVVFAIACVVRNSDWKDDFTLLQITLRQSPDSGYLHNLMAGAWVQRDQFQQALEEQQLAVHYEPRSSVFRKNLGNILLGVNPAAAAREFQIAIALGPDTPELREDLALAQRAMGEKR